MKPEEFIGSSTPLTAGDYAAAATALRVSVERIRAVDEVESRGRGFHPESGRLIILYEPHVFSRLTAGKFDDSHPDLSYPDWGEKPYPGPQQARYAQLFAAMQLDEAAALQACSWGRFQIMGYHFKVCGFPAVQAFVKAMVLGEAQHLVAFAGFILSNGAMLEALRKGDWAGFARRYNGPGYAQHGYDQRLKVAYARQLALAGKARL